MMDENYIEMIDHIIVVYICLHPTSIVRDEHCMLISKV